MVPGRTVLSPILPLRATLINDDVPELSAVRRIHPHRNAGSIGGLKEPRIREHIEKIIRELPVDELSAVATRSGRDS